MDTLNLNALVIEVWQMEPEEFEDMNERFHITGLNGHMNIRKWWAAKIEGQEIYGFGANDEEAEQSVREAALVYLREFYVNNPDQCMAPSDILV